MHPLKIFDSKLLGIPIWYKILWAKKEEEKNRKCGRLTGNTTICFAVGLIVKHDI